MTASRIIVLLLLFGFYTCDSQDMSFEGEYIKVEDSTEILVISKNSINISNSNTEYDNEIKKFYTDKNGEFIEAPSCVDVTYAIDSIDSNDGIYVSAFKNEHRCYSYHLIREGNYLSLTPLKTLKGIEYHFTQPKLYRTLEYSNTRQANKKFTILLDQNIQLNKLNYVAFGQDVPNEEVSNYSDEMKIRLDSSGLNKSNIVLNPMIYAKKLYAAEYIENSGKTIKSIPIIYDYQFHDLKFNHMVESQKMEFQKLGVDDLYLVIGRFNPGRERVVNRLFGEEISGQVQTFVLRSLENDYR